MPMYRSKRGLIYFVHIPKTGGSSIETALRATKCQHAMQMSKAKNTALGYGTCTPQHMHAAVYQKHFPAGFFDLVFAIVRNPYARIASEYRMKVALKDEGKSPDAWISNALARFKKYPYTRDNHIRPQVAFVGPETRVFKLENGLEAPLKAASKALGLWRQPKVLHKRKGPSDKVVISPETLDLIREVYAQDFTEFGYDLAEYQSVFEVATCAP